MSKKEGAVKDWLSNADMLTAALPYMQKYNGSIIVIKYGGNAMADNDLIESFCNDIVFLKQSGFCLLYTSPSPRDRTRSRMPSSA